MIRVDVQVASERDDLPDRDSIARWARAALGDEHNGSELTVRIVDEAEGAGLNDRYRGRPGPTNVLSFAFEAPPGVALALLGDIVICAPVVAREAREQARPVEAHWAHMVIHGSLHLIGHDHLDAHEAALMEGRERRVLADLGFPDPYREAASA